MANGFLTESPAVRHGDTETGSIPDNWCTAQRFTCPGSGTQELTEIGCWGKDNAEPLRLSVWTHDAVNDCPESMVANSESAELAFAVAVGKVSHSYGTLPEVTGGVDYWIATFHGSANQNLDYLAAGTPDDGITQRGSATYPTWPTGTQWETHSAAAEDLGIYVVYQAQAAAGWSAGDLSGVANASIAKVTGIAVADISKINGV